VPFFFFVLAALVFWEETQAPLAADRRPGTRRMAGHITRNPKTELEKPEPEPEKPEPEKPEHNFG